VSPGGRRRAALGPPRSSSGQLFGPFRVPLRGHG